MTVPDPAIQALLTARSVAVVGVSRDPARLGSRILANAIRNGFAGRVHGVARAAFDLDGATIVRSLDEIPGQVDVVLLAVPAEALTAAIDAIPPGKCRVVVAIASGFAEIGAAGEARERELASQCAARGVALVGPNCQGVVIPRVRLQLTFSPMYDTMREGPVAVVAQSGAMGGFMANRLMDGGTGLSAFVSSGNETCLNIADYLAAFGADPRTRVVLAYLEQIRDGRRFCEAVRGLPRDKAVVVVKSGRGSAGVAAVRSHTGAIAGDDAVVDAVLAELGVLRMTDSAAAVDAAALLAGGKMLAGPRIGVLSIAGGLAVEMADLLELGGLEVPRFDDVTVARLRAIVPEFGATRNPIDLTGAVLTDDTLFERALAIMSEAPGLHGWVIISTFVRDPRVARAIVALDRASDCPVVVCWTGSERQTPESLALLREAGVPTYDNPGRAARALAAMHRRADWLRRQAVEPPPAAVPPAALPPAAAPEDAGRVAAARALLADWRASGRVQVHEADAKRWLAVGGIAVPLPPAPGAPAVVKLCADSHLHKTEYGLVRLPVAASDVPAVRDELASRATALGVAAATLLVESLVDDGLLEWLVGCRDDPTMGPIVVVGTGGIYAELFPAPRMHTAPLSVDAARALIRTHPAFPIIDGARGRPRGDLDAFAVLVSRVANLFAACRDAVDELDLNPVVVRPAGSADGAVALDAALVLKPR